MSASRICPAGVIMVVVGTLAGCGLLAAPEDCTLDIRPAILLEVRDSVTSAAVGSGARIIARDGTFADTADMVGPLEGPYRLADEREGTYTVTVEKDGYQFWSRSGVRVTGDQCHVRTVSLTARLKR